MKRVVKKSFKICVIFFLIFGLLLFIGVMIPKKTYREKEEQTESLLIINCNIINVRTGVVIPNRQILVLNNRIASIDSISLNVPQHIKTIDARGQYIIPSLWDMHMHTISLSPQLHFPLLIANGITGVRDMGDGDSWISDLNDNSERDKTIWERQSVAEKLLMPKILQATSFHVEEIEDTDIGNYKLKASELVGKLKARGEPFIKVQLEETEIPEDIFYELQKEAKKQGIPILGHLSPNLDVRQVLDNDFKSIEHAWALIPHFVKEKKNLEKDIEQKKYDLAKRDTAVTRAVLTKMANKGVYYVPTHVTSNRKEYLAFNPDFNHNPNNMYVENLQLFLWKTINWLHTKGYNKETDLPVLEEYYKRGLETTKLANGYGVKILAGTDALDRNVYYGISLHEELQQLLKAGLSNAEALKSATLNAAEYYDISKDYGSIEVGKIADFLMLAKNPLEDIKNTQTIVAVYYRHRLYNSEDLKQMKTFVKKQAKSFGITCKFIWNMIKRT